MAYQQPLSQAELEAQLKQTMERNFFGANPNHLLNRRVQYFPSIEDMDDGKPSDTEIENAIAVLNRAGGFKIIRKIDDDDKIIL